MPYKTGRRKLTPDCVIYSAHDPLNFPSQKIPGQLVLALSYFCSYVQLFFFDSAASLVQEKKNMKRFGKFRDPRFALTTLQNPTCEVRTRAQLIEAAQRALGRQPDGAELPFARRPAAPIIPTPAASTQPPATVPVPENANLPIGATDRLPQALTEPQPEPEPEPEPGSEPEPRLQPQPITQTSSDVVPILDPSPKLLAKQPAKRIRKYKPRPKRQPRPLRFSKITADGDAAEFVAESLDRHAGKSAGPHRGQPFSLPDLERHSRKCDICHHPDRADIEEDFVNWRNADLIRTDYEIPNYRTVYRHAHALRLYDLRRQNLRFAAELLIEHADQATPDPNVILRAIHACARISTLGEWVEPVRRVIMTSGDRQAASAPAPRPAPEIELPQPVPEASLYTQAPSAVSHDTEAGPPFLINNPAIRK
jgi:hypothetical protein